MTVDVTQNKEVTNIAQEKPVEQNLNQTPETKVEETKTEDPNWKAFREARKKDRAEKEAAEKRAAEKDAEVAALKAAMEAAFSKSAPTPQAYQQYYGINQPEGTETEDERIEKKVQEAIAKKEQEYAKREQEREQLEYPNRLASQYSDFHQTIAQENLDYLDYHYPEVSRPLGRLPDGYDKWADIYKAVKKFVPNSTTAKKDAAKAEVNMNKPRSISSTGITQPGEAATSARLTEERRAQNWERMQKILKGVG